MLSCPPPALCCSPTLLFNSAKRRKLLHLPAILSSSNAILPPHRSSPLSLYISTSRSLPLPSVHPHKLPTCTFIIHLPPAIIHVLYRHFTWWIPDACCFPLFIKYFVFATNRKCVANTKSFLWGASILSRLESCTGNTIAHKVHIYKQWLLFEWSTFFIVEGYTVLVICFLYQ